MKAKPFLNRVAFMASMVSFSIVQSGHSEEIKVDPLAIGSRAPDFSLPGVDDRDHTLAEFAKSDVLAVLFTCNHCPTAHAYEERVNQIVSDYADKSFSLVAISPNDPGAVRLDELGYSIYGDSLEDMKSHAAKRGFKYPYLYDGATQVTSKAYGVLATPHVFIFDRERLLRYQGRIDDNEKGDNIKSRDARIAIDALLAGKDVPAPTTRVFGCSTKWAGKRDAGKQADDRWNALPVSVEPIDADGVKALSANATGKLRLLNVWATWCGPCVTEMPELVKINRMYQGRDFELITISRDTADDAEKVLRFVRQQHLAMSPKVIDSVKEEGRGANNYHYQSDDYDALADSLDAEWRGPLPYTVLVAPGGKVLYRREGEIDSVELREAIVNFLGRAY